MDLLSTDLNTLDISRPLIKGGLYTLRIDKAEIGKANSGKEKIVLTLKTTVPATSDKGKPVEAGLTLGDSVMLEPSGNATVHIVSRNVAALIQSAGGVKGATLKNAATWVPQLTGKTVTAQVDLEPESERDGRRFDARNNIRRYVKKA